MKIDPKFLDVDFTRDHRYVQGYAGKQDLSKCMAKYADVAHVYSDADLREKAELMKKDGGGPIRLVTRVFNQKSEGSCVGNGATQNMEVCQARQFGRDRVIPLSPMSLYQRIGRSAQSGAMVDDAWTELEARGVLPLDTAENKAKFKHTMAHTGFSQKTPAGWEETAAMFKGLEATVCDSLAELKSALADGWGAVVGREGHCIWYGDLVWDGRWMVAYVNSWGKWGQAYGGLEYGVGFDSESQIKKSAGWAFCIRSITRPTFQGQA